MSSGPRIFPSDAYIAKAVKAVVAAGVPVGRVEIERGKIIVIAGKQEQNSGDEETSADLRSLL
jgi:hypothetical protein